MVDRVNLGGSTEPQPNGPDDDALAQKFRDRQTDPNNETNNNSNNNNDNQGEPSRPDWLPEKFNSAEDLAKAYSELEKRLGSNQQDNQGDPNGNQGNQDNQGNQSQDDAAGKAAGEAGLDLNALSQEFMDNGGLKDESYQALEKAGYSRDMVDTYIAGAQAKGQTFVNAAYEAAGGEEAFNQAKDWAAQGMSESDLKTYHDLINSGDTSKVAMGAKFLTDKYTAENGQPPSRRISGSGNAPVNEGIYTSREQMKADMRSDRYKTDPAFRAQVAEKLGRSNIMGRR